VLFDKKIGNFTDAGNKKIIEKSCQNSNAVDGKLKSLEYHVVFVSKKFQFTKYREPY